MKANEFSAITNADLDGTNIDVATVHSSDIQGVSKRIRISKPKVWKYVLGDVYQLCYARDRHDAMLAFGAIDNVRVDCITLGDEFVYNLFNEGSIVTSAYDGRNLFQFKFK